MAHDLAFVIASMNHEALLAATCAAICDSFKVARIQIVVKRKAADQSETRAAVGNVSITELRRDDCGIYDAWNQALEAVCARYVLFIGEGDIVALAGPDAEPALIRFLADKPHHAFVQVGRPPAPAAHESAWHRADVEAVLEINRRRLRRQLLFCQPLLAHNTDTIKAVGGFDPRYKIIGDYDFLLRAHNCAGATHFIAYAGDLVRVDRVPGGISENPKYRAKLLGELFRMKLRHGIWPISTSMITLSARLIRYKFGYGDGVANTKK